MNFAYVKQRSLILAVHPTARGVGWALFESALAPLDWAVVRSNKNPKCLARIEQIIERHTPNAIILEQFERDPSRRADRIQRLCRAVTHLAQNRGIETRVYSRAAIRTCFVSAGAVTRYEIAQAIATHIHAFRHRLPPVRKPWMSEDPRLSIFNAAALAITHFAFGGNHNDASL